MFGLHNQPGADENWQRSQLQLWQSCSWQEFQDFLFDCSKTRFQSKQEAPLICPHRFRHDSRARSNAIDSWWIGLDVDGGNYPEVLAKLKDQEFASLAYTSASYQEADHRFRVIVPFEHPIPSEHYYVAARGLMNILDLQPKRRGRGEIDRSKLGKDCFFYVPGTYEGALNNPVISFSGSVAPAIKFINACPDDVELQPEHETPPDYMDWQEYKRQVAVPSRPPPRRRLWDYLTEEKIAEYADVSPGHGRTQALFGLMVSAIQRGIFAGYTASPDEVAELARAVDLSTDSYHHRKYPKNMSNYANGSARRAIACAQHNVRRSDEFTVLENLENHIKEKNK